jgi:hypothetical protein
MVSGKCCSDEWESRWNGHLKNKGQTFSLSKSEGVSPKLK